MTTISVHTRRGFPLLLEGDDIKRVTEDWNGSPATVIFTRSGNKIALRETKKQIEEMLYGQFR